MPCLLALVALLFPRLVIIVLWFFTEWFTGVFNTLLWPALGFFFLPITMLWYSVVIKQYAGEWTTGNIVIMVIAILIDMGSWGGVYCLR